MEWISVNDKLPECYHQHRNDYGSGYVLVFDIYNEISIFQLWSIRQKDGTYKYHWEDSYLSDKITYDEITHWMPLPPHPKK